MRFTAITSAAVLAKNTSSTTSKSSTVSRPSLTCKPAAAASASTTPRATSLLRCVITRPSFTANTLPSVLPSTSPAASCSSASRQPARSAAIFPSTDAGRASSVTPPM
jgi:hypothetical protein